MRYLSNPCTDAHYNMAFDDWCLEQMPSDAPFFYLWQNAPSVIIGLNQNPYTQVNLAYLQNKGIKLARRVTGGGAVYHDLGNLNYTIVGRSRDLDADYPGYLNYIVDALRRLGANVELTGRNDILLDSRKVSGFAKRVYKDRLMVHGTLMFDVDVDTLTEVLSTPGAKIHSGVDSVRSRVCNLKDALPQFRTVLELKEALWRILSDDGRDSEIVLKPEDIAAVRKSCEDKFATWEWNYGRSPEAGMEKSARFACGTVTATIVIDNGRIGEIHFGGDYIGNLPASPLEAALRGVKFDSAPIKAVLDNFDVENCFDSLTSDELARLLLQ